MRLVIGALLGVCLGFLLSCGTAKQANDKGQFKSKRMYALDARVLESSEGCKYHVKRSGDLGYGELQWLLTALKEKGLPFSEKSGTCDLVMKLQTKKPKFGISFGIINPYKHILEVLASRDGQTLWVVEVEGPGMDGDRRKVLPSLVSLSKDYFNRSSNGRQVLRLAADDPKLTGH